MDKDKYSHLVIHYDSKIEDKVYELFANFNKHKSTKGQQINFERKNNYDYLKISNKYYDCMVKLNRVINPEDCAKINDVDGLIYFFTAESLSIKVFNNLNNKYELDFRPFQQIDKFK